MRFIIGLALGLSIATVSSFALEPNWAQRETDRMQQQQENFNQQLFREQQQRQLFQRPPC